MIFYGKNPELILFILLNFLILNIYYIENEPKRILLSLMLFCPEFLSPYLFVISALNSFLACRNFLLFFKGFHHWNCQVNVVLTLHFNSNLIYLLISKNKSILNRSNETLHKKNRDGVYEWKEISFIVLRSCQHLFESLHPIVLDYLPNVMKFLKRCVMFHFHPKSSLLLLIGSINNLCLKFQHK